MDISRQDQLKLSDLAVTAYQRELDQELGRLMASFGEWRAGRINGMALTEQLHDFSSGVASQLSRQYCDLPPEAAVAKGVAKGVLKESEIPQGVLAKLRAAVELYRDVLRMESQGGTAPAAGPDIPLRAPGGVPAVPPPVIAEGTVPASSEPKEYRCPHCQRLIFNRRLPTCEFCGQEIPAELLYSPEEVARANELIKGELERQMQQMQKDRELEEKRRAERQGRQAMLD